MTRHAGDSVPAVDRSRSSTNDPAVAPAVPPEAAPPRATTPRCVECGEACDPSHYGTEWGKWMDGAGLMQPVHKWCVEPWSKRLRATLSLGELPDGYNAGELSDADVPRLAGLLAPLYGEGSIVRWVLEHVATLTRSVEEATARADRAEAAAKDAEAALQRLATPTLMAQPWMLSDMEELHARCDYARNALAALRAALSSTPPAAEPRNG